METPLIGNSEEIQRIRDLIDHVADTGLSVVITGESGVGKEVVAQNLYCRSKRSKNPFIKINCAALPEGLLESELFGFEQGAFTGAQRKKRGKFELANKGVLFLDEICDMSLPLQAKLLHVLQSGEFSRLGSEKDVKSDVWIIAATNQDLEGNVKQQIFREDLYYRLNIIRISIPPLRERPEDIPELTAFFLEQYAAKFDEKKFNKPSKEHIDQMMAYDWPGNVRELQNVIKRGLVVSNWDEIAYGLSATQKCTDAGHEETPAIDSPVFANDIDWINSPSFSLKSVKKKALDKIEKEVITHVLDKTGWNRSKATKVLKISYKTLLYKISDLDIKPPETLPK